jgi:hypothetical protein
VWPFRAVADASSWSRAACPRLGSSGDVASRSASMSATLRAISATEFDTKALDGGPCELYRCYPFLPEADSSALHDAVRILPHNSLSVNAVLIYNALRLKSRQAVLLQEQDALSGACALRARDVRILLYEHQCKPRKMRNSPRPASQLCLILVAVSFPILLQRVNAVTASGPFRMSMTSWPRPSTMY